MNRSGVLLLLLAGIGSARAEGLRLTLTAEGGYDDRPHLRLAEPHEGDEADPAPIGRLRVDGIVPVVDGDWGALQLRPSGELFTAGGEDPFSLWRAELEVAAATGGERPFAELVVGGRLLGEPEDGRSDYRRLALDARVRALRGTVDAGLIGQARLRRYPDLPLRDFSAYAGGVFGRLGLNGASVELQYLLQGNEAEPGAGEPEGHEREGQGENESAESENEVEGIQHIVRAIGFWDPTDTLSLELRYSLRVALEGEFERERRPSFGPGGMPDEDADEVSGGEFSRHAWAVDVTWLATDTLTLSFLGDISLKRYGNRVSRKAPERRRDVLYGLGTVGRYALGPRWALLASAALRGDDSTDPVQSFTSLMATGGVQLRF